MNQYSVPDWSLDEEPQTLHQKRTFTHDNELVELLWRDGHVVMQSQSTWKPPSAVPEPGEDRKLRSSIGNSNTPTIQEDGPLPWFQYHLDDPLEKDLSDYLCEIPELNKNVSVEQPEKYVRFGAAEDGNNFTMPPPNFGCAQEAPSLASSGVINRLKDDLGSRSGGVGIGESSSPRTVGSSACGSNQADIDTKDAHGRGVKERGQMNTFDYPTGTSSSGGSGCSFGITVGKRSAGNQNHKRKRRGGEHSEEEAEYESIDANRPAQRSVSKRKSRAAEVHNLSERRRRDRINEKMKALQELIPHCNKSDKASMLDEAIEYLKSLQLQLQIMWMGSGMAPMMFPGVQQYMSRVASMPWMNNPIQMPRAPPTQTVHRPEMYAQYLGFPHMQLPPQAMNLYAYGSHMAQQNQTAIATGSGSLMTAGIPSEKIQNGPSG